MAHRTARLSIEPLTLAHADELRGLTDPRVYTDIAPEDAPRDLPALRAQFAALLADLPDPRPGERFLNHAVRLSGTSACIGRLEAYVHGTGDVEIAFLFVPDCWGAGYAREAVAWLLHDLAADHGARRIWACVTPGNQRSLALCRRLGFSEVSAATLPDLASHEPGDVVLSLATEPPLAGSHPPPSSARSAASPSR